MRRSEAVEDPYPEALAAFRRLYRGPEWPISLLCGLRYHPEMVEVVKMIHTYANEDALSLPDWRVAEPPEKHFAKGFGPHAVQIDGKVRYARATGNSSTKLVWRLYRTPEGVGHVGDLMVLTSGGIVPLASIDRRPALNPSTSHIGIVIGGELHRAI
jgi:hypothetical protein